MNDQLGYVKKTMEKVERVIIQYIYNIFIII